MTMTTECQMTPAPAIELPRVSSAADSMEVACEQFAYLAAVMSEGPTEAETKRWDRVVAVLGEVFEPK